MALVPNTLDLRLQSAVIGTGIDLFEFYELVLGYHLAEFIHGKEMILHTILFLPAWSPGSG